MSFLLAVKIVGIKKISIVENNLQKIKSELLTIVKTHILQQNNTISQSQSNNSTTQNTEETLEL